VETDGKQSHPMEVYRRFGGTYSLNFERQSIRQQETSLLLLLASFMLGFLCDPEDGVSTFLRNVDGLIITFRYLPDDNA
jgi:hypothetical protein